MGQKRVSGTVTPPRATCAGEGGVATIAAGGGRTAFTARSEAPAATGGGARPAATGGTAGPGPEGGPAREPAAPHGPRRGALRRGSLGAGHILFFVVAAAAPLTAVLGGVPGAIAFGHPAGVPGAFVIAGLLYLAFAAGLTAMARHIANAGAFYAYIGAGLGPAAGLAGAFLALLAYQAIQIAVYGLLGLVLAQASAGLLPDGARAPWWAGSALAIAAVLACGRRNVLFSSRVLGVCLTLELGVLVAVDLAMLAHGGPQGWSLAPFAPREILAPGLGAAMVFVIACFVGFEATAIFGEEARRPAQDIPRATYGAVALIAVLYAASAYAALVFHGEAAVAEAARSDPTGLYLGPARALLGEGVAETMNLLLMLSLFACALSLHGAIARYLFALARNGVGTHWLATPHPRHGGPSRAGLAQSAAAAGMLAVFALTGQDPFAVVFSWMSALGSLAILAVQVLCAAAIIAFFRADPRGVGRFRRLVAPALAGAGLTACLLLVVMNLPLLAGSDSAEVHAFPALVALVGLAGAVLGRLKRPQPLRGDDAGGA
ncbi:APC family permease [Ancylobacter lacus]|uniref:APC family permease n=1 Tax=Ancylobacter lacus TaxID=2579970 RepID=UPI001BD06EF5|nr:APC family permease [Ancylobacter lacus]MBS7538776.1 APC family permease [Ancylobacter lacus]